MTYLGVSVLLFLAPFLLGLGLVAAVIAAGALMGSLSERQAASEARRTVPAPRGLPQTAFDQAPGFQIVDLSFRHH